MILEECKVSAVLISERLWEQIKEVSSMDSFSRFRLVRANLCTDLYENLVGGQILSYEHKFQIS